MRRPGRGRRDLARCGQSPFPAARAALDDEDVQVAVARGRRMSLDEAMAVIVELGDSVVPATIGP
jgi:hypothetical protein